MKRRFTVLICLGVTLGVSTASAQNPGSVSWGTFLGGSAGDTLQDLVVDAQGFIYVCGNTSSPDFPSTPNVYDLSYNGSSGENNTPYLGDGYIAKLDPATGYPIWATVIGGSHDEELDSIAIGPDGGVYFMGYTFSPDFPTTPGAFDRTHNGAPDIFVGKLDAAGQTLLHCTFIGGEWSDTCFESPGIVVDSQGYVYIAGITDSTTFPVTPGAFDTSKAGPYGGVTEALDGFVAKLAPDMSHLVYASYIGGSLADWCQGMAVNEAGEVFICGRADSVDFPVTPGAYDTTLDTTPDGFVARFSADGSSLVYCTFLGGSKNDLPNRVILLPNDDAYIAGVTSSVDFPVTAGAFDLSHNGPGMDIFVSRLSAAGDVLQASTQLGGIGRDAPFGLAIAANGDLWIGGDTESPDFPTTRGALDRVYSGGGADSIVAALSSDLSTLVYATFLGGDSLDYGAKVALGPQNVVFAGLATWSASFQVTSGAFDTTFSGDGTATGDAGIVRLDLSNLDLDTDADGLPDWWETFYGTNPNGNDAVADPDADGLTNVLEFQHDTRPFDADADADGANDGAEVTAGSDPFDSDTDNDGLGDWDELRDLSATPGIQNPFSPLSNDSTADGGVDAPDGVLDGDNDYDGDAIANRVEFEDGTDPTDPTSFTLHPTKSYSLGPATPIVTTAPGVLPFNLEWSHDGKRLGYEDVASGQCFQVPSDGDGAPTPVNTGGRRGPFAWGLQDLSWWRTDDVPPFRRFIEIRLSDQYIMNARSLPNHLIQAPHFSQRSGTNLMAFHVDGNDNDIYGLPVSAFGEMQRTAARVQLTDLPLDADTAVKDPRLSADASQVAFSVGHPTPPFEARIYVLRRVQDIAAALTAPPTSFDDPRLTVIDDGPGFVTSHDFTADGSTVLYAKDITGLYDNTSLINTDFEIVLRPSNASSPAIIFAKPGNQGIMRVSPGGTRVAYVDDSSGTFEICVASLEVTVPLAGTTAASNYGGAGNDGVNDIVADNATQVADVSGTRVLVPEETVVDFPAGSSQQIVIYTPSELVQQPQLPSDVTGIPVVREFGPDGTTFSPPVAVTITYTDAEIRGLDEASLRVFKFNSATGLYDIEVTDIIERDLENNRIVFAASSFSTYGLGTVVDTDGDGEADDIDLDDDADGVPDVSDACPLDTDDDGVANGEDPDDDADGLNDTLDAFLFDTDNDTVPNATDPDDDADAIADASDPAPFDTDNDGLRNDLDPDDDGDGHSDAFEATHGTNPLDPAAFPSLPLAWWPLLGALLAFGSAVALRRRVGKHP